MEYRKQIDGATIIVTFDWDTGDPSVGIGEGWGENTGIEIVCSPFVMLINFRDIDSDGHFLTNPADWLIEDVEMNYQGAGASMTVADRFCRQQWEFMPGQRYDERLIRLGEWPEVCTAVQTALDNWNALARLACAKDVLASDEAYLKQLEHVVAFPDERDMFITDAEIEGIPAYRVQLEETKRMVDIAQYDVDLRGLGK